MIAQRRRADHGHLVDQGAVVLAVGIDALERQDVAAGADGEDAGAIGGVARTRRVDRADDNPVDQHLDLLAAVVAAAALGCREHDQVTAGRPGDRLADGGAAAALKHGDLGALRRVRIGTGEAAAVAGHGGGAGERPRGAAWGVLEVPEGAGTHVRCLEAGVGDGQGALDGHLVDEGGVVEAVRVDAEELDGVFAGGHREDHAAVQGIGRAGRGEQPLVKPVDQHLDVLAAVVAGAALGGVEGDDVAAGGHRDRLADGGAAALQHADLGTLRGVGIGAGETAAVAGDTGGAGERPGGATWVVLKVPEGAGADVRRLEARVDQRRSARR